MSSLQERIFLTGWHQPSRSSLNGDENIYIITGDSGNGMTHGTLGGIIISDMINGVKNPWEGLYDPSRHTLKTTGDYLHEVGNMAAQYADWISSEDIKTRLN